MYVCRFVKCDLGHKPADRSPGFRRTCHPRGIKLFVQTLRKITRQLLKGNLRLHSRRYITFHQGFWAVTGLANSHDPGCNSDNSIQTLISTAETATWNSSVRTFPRPSSLRRGGGSRFSLKHTSTKLIMPTNAKPVGSFTRCSSGYPNCFHKSHATICTL